VWVDLDRFNAVDVASAQPSVFSWRLLAHDALGTGLTASSLLLRRAHFFQHTQKLSFQLQLLLSLSRRLTRCLCFCDEAANKRNAPLTGANLRGKIDRCHGMPMPSCAPDGTDVSGKGYGS